MNVKFYVQNGGGIADKSTIIKSYSESLGFNKYIFKFNPSDKNEFNEAIISILFYLFTVRDSVASLYVKGGNFLNLDILNIYTGKEFHSTTYDYAFKPSII